MRSSFLLGSLLLGAGAVLHSSPALAQDSTVRSTLGDLLTRARESGALERVLGERFYRYDRVQKDSSLEGKDPDLILVTRGAQDSAQETLTLSFTLANADVRLELAYTYGFDGALRSMAVHIKQGAQDIRGQGDVGADGALALQIARGDEEPQTREVAWHDDALPELMSLIVLPVLADQGLPDAVTFYAFEGEDLRLNDSRTTTIRRQAEPVECALGPAQVFSLVEDEREKGRTLVLTEGADRGRLALIEIDARKQITPVSAEDGVSWLDTLGAE
jgi:hypothetical protein